MGLVRLIQNLHFPHFHLIVSEVTRDQGPILSWIGSDCRITGDLLVTSTSPFCPLGPLRLTSLSPANPPCRLNNFAHLHSSNRSWHLDHRVSL